MALAIVLAAAFCLGLGFVLQQRAAEQAPLADFLSPRLLIDLVRKPMWLLGIAAMVGGQVLGALALGRVDITLVEPLLAANLLFALALSALIWRQRVGLREWSAAVLLGVGIGIFIGVGRPHGGGGTNLIEHWSVVGGIALFALAFLLIARTKPMAKEAAFLAASAGCLYGLQDGFTRRSLLILDHGWVHLLESWQPYTVIVIAIVGLTLAQSAFEAAPLKQSLPAITAAEPVTGIAFGIGVFGERLQTTPWAIGGEVIGLIAIVTGVVLLARSPALVEGTDGDGEPEAKESDSEAAPPKQPVPAASGAADDPPDEDEPADPEPDEGEARSKSQGSARRP